jgi:hypothetical protein
MSDDLPEVYSEPTDSGFVTIVTNKKARRFINACFDSPLRWNRVNIASISRRRHRGRSDTASHTLSLSPSRLQDDVYVRQVR